MLYNFFSSHLYSRSWISKILNLKVSPGFSSFKSFMTPPPPWKKKTRSTDIKDKKLKKKLTEFLCSYETVWLPCLISECDSKYRYNLWSSSSFQVMLRLFFKILSNFRFEVSRSFRFDIEYCDSSSKFRRSFSVNLYLSVWALLRDLRSLAALHSSKYNNAKSRHQVVSSPRDRSPRGGDWCSPSEESS